MKTVLLTRIALVVAILIAGLLLIPGIRGTNDDLTYYQTTHNREVGGPFESSGSTSRYQLTETFAREGRVTFASQEAQFASPDVSGSKGVYFSLFMPGVSLAGVPFYMLGEMFNLGQVGAYGLNLVASLLNLILIAAIVHKMTGKVWTGLVTGLVFLFATSAFPYSFFYTQHPLSTFCLLTTLLIYVYPTNLMTLILAGFIYGFGIFTDIPNAIILLPVMLGIFFRNFSWEQQKGKFTLQVKWVVIGLLLGVLPMLYALGTYNHALTNSPFVLPQFIGRSTDFSENPTNLMQEKSPSKDVSKSQFDHNAPFFSRFTINGLYILLISNERGWIVYSPIVLIGLLGLIYGLKKKSQLTTTTQILLSTILVNVLLYSMFGDPWGGWSFGPRYLIPATATMCILGGYAIGTIRNKLVITLIVLPLLLYSVFVNTLGALTTAQVPPKQEAELLQTSIPYTYEYNWNLLNSQQTRSFFYNTTLRNKISIHDFYIFYSLTIYLFIVAIYMASLFEQPRKGQV